MFGDSDARRDDLGTDAPLEIAEELDPMDAGSDDQVPDSAGDWDDEQDDDPDGVSDGESDGDVDDDADDDDDDADGQTDETEDDDADDDDADDDDLDGSGDEDPDEVGDDESSSDDPSGSSRSEDGDSFSAEVPYAPLDTTSEVPAPPVTGDQAVDEAMMRLAQSQAGSFAERIESGEHAHRSLQSRLGGLGGA